MCGGGTNLPLRKPGDHWRATKPQEKRIKWQISRRIASGSPMPELSRAAKRLRLGRIVRPHTDHL